MEFNEKLQELRKKKGLTQEELAKALFVSRTAISKWESGRGYPGIESLKMIASFFSVSIDTLLSGDEVLCIAETESKQKENRVCDLAFGLLDVSVALLMFLPFFGQKTSGIIEAVSLILLNVVSPYLKALYFVLTSGIIVSGILTLTLQNCDIAIWNRIKRKLSLILNSAGILLFIISSQPYAATLLFVFLLIRVLMLIKWQ